MLAGKSPIIRQLHFFFLSALPCYHGRLAAKLDGEQACMGAACTRKSTKNDVVKINFQEFVVDIGVVIFRK